MHYKTFVGPQELGGTLKPRSDLDVPKPAGRVATPAPAKPVPVAKVKPASKPTTPPPEPRPTQQTHDEVQREIDRVETELEASGANLSRLIHPSVHAPDLLKAGYKPMPKKLADLYKERDAIEAGESRSLVSEMDKRLTSSVPNTQERAELSRKLAEADAPAALRREFSRESWKGVGDAANTIAHYVAEKITKEPEDVWFKIDAVLGGTPESPGLQLRMSGAPGAGKPSTKTIAKAQEILDALMEGNAPRLPTTEVRPQAKTAQTKQLAKPTPREAPPPTPKLAMGETYTVTKDTGKGLFEGDVVRYIGKNSDGTLAFRDDSGSLVSIEADEAAIAKFLKGK
jgi:hypothetical protein